MKYYEDFPKVIEYIYGPEKVEEKIAEFASYKTVCEFQEKFMDEAIKAIAKKTTTEFTWDGLQNLDKGKGYLFVSNHRDIGHFPSNGIKGIIKYLYGAGLGGVPSYIALFLQGLQLGMYGRCGL